MFGLLVGVGAVIGGVVGFLLSRAATAVSPERKRTLIGLVVGALIGAGFGVIIWVAGFLLVATLQLILWVVLALVVILIIWFVYTNYIRRNED